MTAKRMTAVELRKNLARFESNLKRDHELAVGALARLTDKGLADSRYYAELQGELSAYRGILESLHIWTDGEFGERPAGGTQ